MSFCSFFHFLPRPGFFACCGCSKIPVTPLSLHSHPLQWASVTAYQDVRPVSYPLNLGWPCVLHQPTEWDRMNECQFWASRDWVLPLGLLRPFHHHLNEPQVACWRMTCLRNKVRSPQSPFAHAQTCEKAQCKWPETLTWLTADHRCMSEPSQDQENDQLTHEQN